MDNFTPSPVRIKDPNHASHQAAAENHGLAAKHHAYAATYLNAGDHQLAAHHMQLAHGFSLNALHHGAAANRHYLKVYGPPPPDQQP